VGQPYLSMQNSFVKTIQKEIARIANGDVGRSSGFLCQITNTITAVFNKMTVAHVHKWKQAG